jgi:DNA-directed RNA polymerase specialized sigma24 family protein
MMHSGINFEAAAMPLMSDLYRTAFRMVHDEAAAERFVKRTFVEVRRESRPMWDADQIRLQLFRGLFREIHQGRKAWLHIKTWLTGDADTPDDYSDRNEILRELDGIPGTLREAVLLADVEGFNKRELARILEIPEELAASRLAEGRSRLREALADSAAPARVSA